MRFLYALCFLFFDKTGFLASLAAALWFVLGTDGLVRGIVSGFELFLGIVMPAVYSGIAWLLCCYFKDKLKRMQSESVQH